MNVVNVIAILVSPLIAVLITVYLQNRKEKHNLKMRIFGTLMATRHSPIRDESVRALNMIDVVFSNKEKVRKLWHEYYDMLNNQGLQNEQGFNLRQKKNLELITEMANEVGYGKEITHLDVDRVYYPQGMGKAQERSEEMATEWLRVLKNTERFMTVSRTNVETE